MSSKINHVFFLYILGEFLMCKFFLRKLVVFLLVLIAQPLYAGGNIYCWLNDNNVKECANYIPQQYSQRGFVEYDRYGNKIQEVAPALTPEEIAEIKRKQIEKIRREEQRKKDQKLLALFSSESDIEAGRKSELSTIDAQIQSIQSILDGLRRNLNDLQESYKLSKNIPEVPKSQLRAIQMNIKSIKKRIEDTEDTLQKMREERVKTNNKYDAYVRHYQEIQERRRAEQRAEAERFSLTPQ